MGVHITFKMYLTKDILDSRAVMRASSNIAEKPNADVNVKLSVVQFCRLFTIVDR